MSIPVIIGDRVTVITGVCIDRGGIVRRTTRQLRGKRQALFWVEIAPGEVHAFLREEFVFDGHVYESDQARKDSEGT